MMVVGVIALALHGTVIRLLLPFVRGRPGLREMVNRTRNLIRYVVLDIAFGLVLPATLWPAGVMATLGRILLIIFVLLIGWGGVIAIGIATDLYLHRWRIDEADNLLARKHVTQVRVLRRTAVIVTVVITVAIALMVIPAMQKYGVSLFASAGASALVVGLAARPLLTNLIAGIQIAVTQPIRIEDAVVVEGQWGWIEEIASTYVVVRIWNWTRMVLPLSYFIETPFQNWTRASAQLIGQVHINVDYATPLRALREKVEEIAKQSKLWDGQVVNMQVVEATEKSIQLRILVSARNSGESWDLRCEMREKIITWLAAAYPEALPKLRADTRAMETTAVARPGAADNLSHNTKRRSG
jgi:small-conductance mechanosensitive channel